MRHPRDIPALGRPRIGDRTANIGSARLEGPNECVRITDVIPVTRECHRLTQSDYRMHRRHVDIHTRRAGGHTQPLDVVDSHGRQLLCGVKTPRAQPAAQIGPVADGLDQVQVTVVIEVKGVIAAPGIHVQLGQVCCHAERPVAVAEPPPGRAVAVLQRNDILVPVFVEIARGQSMRVPPCIADVATMDEGAIAA